MTNIVVIIPIHEFNDNICGLLKNAINSVPQDIEIRLSCRHDISKQLIENIISKSERKGIVLYESQDENSKTDFATLVNQAVGDSEWFSILEYDDTYTKIWFDNVKKYIDYEPSVSVFLPLTDLIDFNNKKYIGLGNEAPWATSFSNELGYIDNDCLENYFDFYLTGSVFNTEDWIQNGGLKSSIKITFWYEFLLRMTNKDKKIFVIPKIGYNHSMNRKDSLLSSYVEIDEKERMRWFGIAKEESQFKEERTID